MKNLLTKITSISMALLLFIPVAKAQGLSSKGDPIDEVWTKREKIGL